MTVLDDERKALAVLLDEQFGNWQWDSLAHGMTAGRYVAPMVLAAGFRRQGPITDAQVKALGDTLILRFHQFIHEDAPRDAIDQIARVALESARGTS
jgi:hypothetical protein